MKVKAFLLAAGMGTRLRPLTDNTPKCLLPILGRPLLDLWFDNLRDAGVDEVLVNTHWLEDRVLEYLEMRGDALPSVTVLREPELLGSAGTLAAGAEWAKDADAIVSIYADLLSTQSVSEVVTFHRSHDLPFTLSVLAQDEPWRRGIATVDENGIVTKFIEKPTHPESDLAGAGIYVMNQEIMREVVALGKQCPAPFDIGKDLLPTLAGRMKAFNVTGIIHDIGTLKAYEEAQDLAKTHGLIR